MGAVVDTQVDWINGDVSASVEEIVEHFTELFTVAAYASVVDVAAICKPAANRAAGLGRTAASPVDDASADPE